MDWNASMEVLQNRESWHLTERECVGRWFVKDRGTKKSAPKALQFLIFLALSMHLLVLIQTICCIRIHTICTVPPSGQA